ncbi:MAG: hypothetical protein ABIQ60_04675 [Burkholderiaceae bacterium]
MNINNLRDCDGRVTAKMAVPANAGAVVQFSTRAALAFADD